MRFIYRCLAVLLLIALCGSIQVSATSSILPQTSVRAAILMDQYGQVLYAHNADASLPMASTTKIMTALVALKLGDLNMPITVSKEAVGVEGSSAYLMEGERMTLETLLYALLLQSANDAAAAIAIGLSGSVDAFVEEMNRTAETIGLSHTHYVNPHGLDHVDHYTSAHDLAQLTAEALRHPDFAKIVSTVRYEAPLGEGNSSRLFVNHNRLLREYKGCVGVKTGYTKRSGRCLVSAATRDSITLIAVTLGAPNDWQDHKLLLNYGFSVCEQICLTPSAGISVSIPVVGGSVASLSCESKETVSLQLPINSRPTMVLELPHFVYAGIPKGKPMGRAVWYLNDRPIASQILYAAEDVGSQEYPLTLWERIGKIFSHIARFIRELFKIRN